MAIHTVYNAAFAFNEKHKNKTMKRNIVIWCLIWIVNNVGAIAPDSIIALNEHTGKELITILPTGMDNDVDSLLDLWYSKNFLSERDDCHTTDISPTFSDSIYIDRLSRIPAVMEMPYNDVVRKMIDLYAGKLRYKVAYMLGAMNFYTPIFEEALDAYNIPNELKYLPIIESALNPTAVSRAGASGLWQFIISTGKIYGMNSNSWIDERRDPIKSSYAAARYLKELHDIYGDWSLVIAAYNCGPGNVNKAIHRAGDIKDYWTIYNYLPKETRGYVPAFIAANYIMTYYCEHNICPMETQLPMATDTLLLTRDLHFQQIADLCNINIEQIRALNPQYKRDVIPGNSIECTLRLPNKAISAFISHGDSVYTHRIDELFTRRKKVEIKDSSLPSNKKGTKGKSSLVYHRIKQGENLSIIAKRYGVTVSKLKAWNGLRNTKITAGKRLKIYR